MSKFTENIKDWWARQPKLRRWRVVAAVEALIILAMILL